MPVTDAAVNAAIPTDGTQPSRALTQALFKAVRGAEVTVANPASPYAWDIGVNPVIRITGLNHALTINASSGVNGQAAALTVVQDATGNRVVTFGTNFRNATTWTDNANAEASFGYRWTNGALNLIGGGAGASGGGGYATVQDEGTALALRAILNFVGVGVTVTDDAANSKTTVTIPGIGGASSFMLTVLDDTTALAARTTLGAVGQGTSPNEITTLWRGTQAAYDALGSKDAATLYVISG